MINKLMHDAQERLWDFISIECQIIHKLSLPEITDLHHRAGELSSHPEESWRMTADIIKNICELEIEKRK